ncbi:MAG: hypothetical protein ACREQ5_09390, partial [Candidatus Dormibacteria bacterium]
AVAVVILLLIVAAGYGIYSLVSRNGPVPFRNFTVTQITNNGKSMLAAISPDGKYILSEVMNAGKSSLWLRHVPTNSDTQVIAPSDAFYRGLEFSPDGNYIYFRKADTTVQDVFTLYRAPVLGGTPQAIVHDIDLDPAFSPDDKQFAFMRANDPEVGKYQLLTANADGSDQKMFANGPISVLPGDLVWDPNGKQVLENRYQIDGNLTVAELVDLDSGKIHQIAAFRDKLVFGQIWLPDRRGFLILYQGPDTSYTRNQIGYVSLPDGDFHSVTQDTNNYATLTLSADAKTLATIQQRFLSSLYIVPASGPGKTQPQALSQLKNLHDFAWDGNDAFYIREARRLVRMAADGSNETVVLDDVMSFGTSACSDGKTLLFARPGDVSGSGPVVNIWRVSSDGSNPQQLSTGKNDREPLCSPDSKWAYFMNQKDGVIERVSIDGGASQPVPGAQIPHGIVGAEGLGISPDSKVLAFLSTANVEVGTQMQVQKIALVPLDAGPQPQVRFLVPNPHIVRGPSFTPDGKALVYPVMENGITNLWLQPLDGSAGHAFTNFLAEHDLVFHWSPDGKSLAILRGHLDSDVVLLRDTGAASQ